MRKTLELIQQSLDKAEVKHDGIDVGSNCIYVDLVPSAAVVVEPTPEDYAHIEIQVWDASGGLELEREIGVVRVDLAGAVVKALLDIEGENEDW